MGDQGGGRARPAPHDEGRKRALRGHKSPLLNWGLRDYGEAGQIGLEPTPEEYVAKLVQVFREVRRVLRADGTLWLNLGDSYAREGGKTPGVSRHWDDRKDDPGGLHDKRSLASSSSSVSTGGASGSEPFRNSPQNLHLIAQAWIVSAQKGHFFIIISLR